MSWLFESSSCVERFHRQMKKKPIRMVTNGQTCWQAQRIEGLGRPEGWPALPPPEGVAHGSSYVVERHVDRGVWKLALPLLASALLTTKNCFIRAALLALWPLCSPSKRNKSILPGSVEIEGTQQLEIGTQHIKGSGPESIKVAISKLKMCVLNHREFELKVQLSYHHYHITHKQSACCLRKQHNISLIFQ